MLHFVVLISFMYVNLPFDICVIIISRIASQWPRGLRLGSAAVSLLGLRVRIPSGPWMSVWC